MERSLRDLLEIENTAEILEFRCPKTGYLLWPMARNFFLRQLISDLYYKQASLLAPVKDIPYSHALAVLPRLLLHGMRCGKMSGDVLVVSTGAGMFQRDGYWFNRITDYLALESPKDTVTVEGVMDWHIPEPRWNSRVSYWLPWQGLITLAGRICVRDSHVKQAKGMLEHVRLRAGTLFGLTISDQGMQMLVTLVSRKIARLPTMQWVYRRLLERTKPRLVLLEEGCYSERGVFNHVAREMGIRVAEPQHGMVSAGHDAYCYAPLLRESDLYRNYLPHDFLGYGQWWNDQIDVPVEKWIIGNPHYSEQRLEMRGRSKDLKDILILSDGVEFSLYLNLAREAAALLKGRYRVLLRPHPLERARVYADFPDVEDGNFAIDRHRDIYQSFATTYAVAGEVSTGLFEAIGLAEKVLLWETPKARFSYPVHPFTSFTDVETLVAAILEPMAEHSNVTQELIWASDWRDNYQRYLEHVLQESSA